MKKRDAIDVIQTNSRVIHDYETYMPYLMYLSGFKLTNSSNLKNLLSKCYAYFVFVFTFFLVISNFIAVVIVDDVKLKMEAAHSLLLILATLVLILMRYTQSLDEPHQLMKDGFFSYDNEPLDNRYIEIKEYHVWRIRLVSNFCLVTVSLASAFMCSVKQIDEFNIDDHIGKHINTGLPILVYLPFDVTNTTGFLAGYIIAVLGTFYVDMVTMRMQQIFVSIIEQFTAQFKILNMSISNVQERAYIDYNSGCNPSKNEPLEAIYRTKEFQRCISKCLKENAIHHQILLRFGDCIRSFIGTVFCLILLFSIIIFGAIMLTIIEMEELSEGIVLVLVLCTEIVYVFVMCFYGELLLQESEKVFFALWDTPWWNFDKNNRYLLMMMMSNSKKPVYMGVPGLASRMCLESFLDILVRAYQFMNVVRNMK